MKMAGEKRKSINTESGKKRKAISFETKVTIIKRLESGEKMVNVARSYDMNRSTIGTILKNKDRILEHVKGEVPMQSTVISSKRSKAMEEMEKLLSMWIEHQTQNRMHLRLALIQEKAKSLFDNIKVKHGSTSANESFSASHGWFNRFKRRARLHNVAVSGEAACADTVAGEKLEETLEQIIVAWGDVTEVNMNGVWINMCPHFVNVFQGFNQDEENKKVPPSLINISNQLDLNLEEEENSEELLDSLAEELSNDDLMHLKKQQREKEEPAPVRKFDKKKLSVVFSKIDECLTYFEEQDPNSERFAKVKSAMYDAIQCYRFIYNERKRKTV